MINLSNTTAQVLAPGQSITFDIVPFKSGCAEYHREGSSAAVLKCPCAIYEIEFGANIGATAAGVAQLSVMLDGEALKEGTMLSQTAAAGNLNSVSRPGIKVKNTGGNGRISVTNTGTTTVNVGVGALLSIKRVA